MAQDADMEEKLKMLVVDDEVEIQKLIGNCFSLNDELELAFASSFEEARRMIVLLHPRITICDINLPDGNGLDLIKVTRNYSVSNQFIVITGASDLEKVWDALEYCATDYLTKPIDMEIMKRIVSEAVDRYKRWYDLIQRETVSECDE